MNVLIMEECFSFETSLEIKYRNTLGVGHRTTAYKAEEDVLL